MPGAGRLALAAAAITVGFAPASFAAETRVVHRYLSIAISPDGRNVASVEGDASPSGGEPVIRSLMIRTVDGKHTVSVVLPCGGVRECWPSSPVWSADGRTLAFALRKPGTHARSVYRVAADGSDPKDIFDFNGTIATSRTRPTASS
jgi:Tol biopolymer transport system component